MTASPTWTLPGDEGAGDDGAEAFHGEDAVHGQAEEA